MHEPASRLVIVLWAADPGRPALVAAPFVYALAARALELEVEMHYTAAAVRWLLPGVAECAHTDRAKSRRVIDYIRETREAGVRHFACAMALPEHGEGSGLIAESHGLAGAATVVANAVQPGTRTLVF
jgi:uncharacterized protein